MRTCDCEYTVDGKCAYTLLLPNYSPDGQTACPTSTTTTTTTDDTSTLLNWLKGNISNLETWTGNQAKAIVNLQLEATSQGEQISNLESCCNPQNNTACQACSNEASQQKRLDQLEKNIIQINDTITRLLNSVTDNRSSRTSNAVTSLTVPLLSSYISTLGTTTSVTVPTVTVPFTAMKIPDISGGVTLSSTSSGVMSSPTNGGVTSSPTNGGVTSSPTSSGVTSFPTSINTAQATIQSSPLGVSSSSTTLSTTGSTAPTLATFPLQTIPSTQTTALPTLSALIVPSSPSATLSGYSSYSAAQPTVTSSSSNDSTAHLQLTLNSTTVPSLSQASTTIHNSSLHTVDNDEITETTNNALNYNVGNTSTNTSTNISTNISTNATNSNITFPTTLSGNATLIFHNGTGNYLNLTTSSNTISVLNVTLNASYGVLNTTKDTSKDSGTTTLSTLKTIVSALTNNISIVGSSNFSTGVGQNVTNSGTFNTSINPTNLSQNLFNMTSFMTLSSNNQISGNNGSVSKFAMSLDTTSPHNNIMNSANITTIFNISDVSTSNSRTTQGSFTVTKNGAMLNYSDISQQNDNATHDNLNGNFVNTISNKSDNSQPNASQPTEANRILNTGLFSAIMNFVYSTVMPLLNASADTQNNENETLFTTIMNGSSTLLSNASQVTNIHMDNFTTTMVPTVGLLASSNTTVLNETFVGLSKSSQSQLNGTLFMTNGSDVTKPKVNLETNNSSGYLYTTTSTELANGSNSPGTAAPTSNVTRSLANSTPTTLGLPTSQFVPSSTSTASLHAAPAIRRRRAPDSSQILNVFDTGLTIVHGMFLRPLPDDGRLNRLPLRMRILKLEDEMSKVRHQLVNRYMLCSSRGLLASGHVSRISDSQMTSSSERNVRYSASRARVIAELGSNGDGGAWCTG